MNVFPNVIQRDINRKTSDNRLTPKQCASLYNTIHKKHTIFSPSQATNENLIALVQNIISLAGNS